MRSYARSVLGAQPPAGRGDRSLRSPGSLRCIRSRDPPPATRSRQPPGFSGVGQLSHLRRATTPHKLIKTLPALTSCLRTHLETRFVQERSLRSGLPAPNAEESPENSAARSTSSVGARGAVRPGHAPGRHRGHAPRRPQGPEQKDALQGMRDRREAAATGGVDALRPLQALLWEGGRALGTRTRTRQPREHSA